MKNGEFELVPVRDDIPVEGMYRDAVRAFLDSGEAERAVEFKKQRSLQAKYVGLRRARQDLGLDTVITVHRKKGQAILRRVV